MAGQGPSLKGIGKAWAISLQLVSQLSLFGCSTKLLGGSDSNRVEIVSAKTAIMDRNVHGFHQIYIGLGKEAGERSDDAASLSFRIA